MILLINKYIGKIRENVSSPYILLRAKSQDDKYVAISNDGSERNTDEILNATAIKVKEFHRESIFGIDYVSYQISKSGDIGPLYVDSYELLQ